MRSSKLSIGRSWKNLKFNNIFDLAILRILAAKANTITLTLLRDKLKMCPTLPVHFFEKFFNHKLPFKIRHLPATHKEERPGRAGDRGAG